MLDVSNGTQPAEVALNTEWQGTELAWILGVQGLKGCQSQCCLFCYCLSFSFFLCLLCVCVSAFVNWLFDLFCF